MEERKVQSRRELEEEMVRINRKTKWSGKDAGKLAADAIVARVTGAKTPEPWGVYSEGAMLMTMAINSDDRTKFFSDVQTGTFKRCAGAAAFAVELGEKSMIMDATVLNSLKDVKIRIREALMAIMCRIGGADNGDFIPIEVTEGLKIDEYGEAMAAYFIENHARYLRGAYDVIVSNLCRVLAWNLLAQKMAVSYELDVLTQMQVTEVQYLQHHIEEIGVDVQNLAKLARGNCESIEALFDYKTLERLYGDYNVLDGDVVAQCEEHVTALLKRGRWEDAYNELEKEMITRGKRQGE